METLRFKFLILKVMDHLILSSSNGATEKQ